MKTAFFIFLLVISSLSEEYFRGAPTERRVKRKIKDIGLKMNLKLEENETIKNDIYFIAKKSWTESENRTPITNMNRDKIYYLENLAENIDSLSLSIENKKNVLKGVNYKYPITKKIFGISAILSLGFFGAGIAAEITDNGKAVKPYMIAAVTCESVSLCIFPAIITCLIKSDRLWIKGINNHNSEVVNNVIRKQ